LPFGPFSSARPLSGRVGPLAHKEIVMVRFVGLDVHKRVVEACVLDEAGQVLLRRRFRLTRESLIAFAKEELTPEDRVVVEATTNTWAVVGILKGFVAEAVVSNPLRTKAIAEAKVKTDKVDAYILAQLLRLDFLPRVWEPDERTQELRRLTSRRSSQVVDRTAIKNRIHAVLAQRLLEPPVKDLFSKSGLLWLRTLDLDEEGRMMIDSDLRLLEGLEKEIADLELLILRKGYSDDRVKLLMTLPGIDVLSAQTLLAALGDHRRFRDGAHAASYLGLVPRTKQSGNRCYHGPITKAGNSQARSILTQAAHHLERHPGPLGVLFRRLKRKKSHNVAVIAGAHKLVVIAWHLLTNGEPYRYALPQTTEQKLRRLRTRATGERRKPGRKTGKPTSPLCGGRRVRPLAAIYSGEQLPPLQEMPAGEMRTVARAGVAGFVRSINQEQIVHPEKRKDRR
jgi:transposase